MNATPSKYNQRSYSGHYMEVGKNAEEIVIEWLKRKYKVIDHRSNKEFQSKEIDVEVIKDNGVSIFCEIKNDYHLGISENVLFELARVNHTANHKAAIVLGWSAKSESDYILFYAPQKNCIYKVGTGDFINALQRYTDEYRERTNIVYTNTDNIKSTINILIPFDKYCVDIFTIYSLDK